MKRLSLTALIVALVGLAMWLIARERMRQSLPPVSAHRSPGNASTVDTAANADDIPPSLDPTSTPTAPDPNVSLPDVMVDPRLVVEKASRHLTVFSSGEAIKTYRVGLGFSPVGDKEREGDGRTPLGEFYICTKNPESNHRRALGISYPSARHAEAGLEHGLITKRQWRTIKDALGHYARPPWNTALGGEIMIHGGGAEADWTQGCIAVTDDEAEELYNALPMGAPVEILP